MSGTEVERDLFQHAEQRLHLVAGDGVAHERQREATHGTQKRPRVASHCVAAAWLPLPEQEAAVLPPIPHAVLRILNVLARLVAVRRQCMIGHPIPHRPITLPCTPYYTHPGPQSHHQFLIPFTFHSMAPCMPLSVSQHFDSKTI